MRLVAVWPVGGEGGLHSCVLWLIVSCLWPTRVYGIRAVDHEYGAAVTSYLPLYRSKQRGELPCVVAVLGCPLVHSVPRGRYDSPVSRAAEFLACFGVDFILSNAVAGLRILLLRIHGAVSINTALAPAVTPILPVSLAPILIEARRVHVPVRLPLCLFFTVEPLALVQALRST